ncbi:glycerol-3-phosphate acyltransferase 2, mitochondrial [Sceloporus undulatus]|uniref:glycerol-3-phosphate acyltransferase 2, mitochondrial n=1 Tax=Sceloporus undulatus TaxID=8520 RepID=UPI001C4B74C0|nr:glycerol-3-phosphate acyltransferase 2, mitochondrial [Sceloporus undulatus]XP_042332602.1 glycerol-3-phosphate acyltransferase 2, mitochondrial [Sceloporus undulatus]XP_042332603.1 glycerol-3-phosphate acyltransferase 2, mitochondrial [Sceloporus undulatus]XP_042332605.1 glycerol-3-phosphate acyltransferase 2, mitochondrial [Sceloporus undulatus]XP_042332606.1 glycerol-3-phosphate acyltransferase 2, mitochondrial [Sceloporus undulatus]XP_042332607.1 glycerol-3-phosphate acyltransferase 2, 
MALFYGGSSGYNFRNKSSPPINTQPSPVDLGFKMELVMPFWGKYRPFTGRCCQRCTPKSWESFFHKRLTSLGFCNVIKITEENTRYRGWLVRRLCYILAVCDWKVCAETPGDLQKKILGSKRIQDIVCQTVPRGEGDSPTAGISVAQWTKEIHRILCQIQASLSPFLLRLCHWALLKLLNQMFLNVIVHKGQLEMVRKAAQVPDVPMVFLSTHKSHLDGLLIPFLLVSQGFAMPRVAWDCKAFTPKYRAMLTQLGGVFLPEGVEQRQDSKQGTLSKAVVASYVEELLKSRQPLLIFLEETFSGVLQLSASSKEWLSLVVHAFHSGTIPNVLVVPVGVSYDVAPDLGHRGQESPAQTISLWTSLWTVCRAVYRRLGCVRIDFAQPVSLQEYATNNLSGKKCIGRHLKELLLPEILGKSPSKMDCEKLQRWPTGFQGEGAKQEILVDNLSLHSLIAGVSCSAIMAAEVMAALLLHKHQEGVLLSRLMQDFAWLTEEILLHYYDVGFSGQVRNVVRHALLLLRHCITIQHLSVGDVLVTPKKTEAAVTELSQHSAALLPVFIQESLAGCAINALLMELLPFLGSPEQLRDVLLVQEELHNKTFLLAQLLQRDFLLCQPCESVYSYCQAAVDKLILCGLLVAEEVPSDVLVCDTSRKRFKATDDFGDSDSDYGDDAGKQCFKVNQQESSCTFFVFICCLLSPLLKTLDRAAAFLGELKDPQPESQYLESLHQFLVRKAREDCSFECANMTLTAISIQIYKELGVIREVPGQKEATLHLSETFAAKENQEKLEKFIRQFIYN